MHSISAHEWTRLADALIGAISMVSGNPSDDFIRGFVDGYLDLGYHTAFGVTHSMTVCVPTDRYRHGYVVGQASRQSPN